MTEEWGLSKAALGLILPLELVGMGVGAVFLGSYTDVYGRRPSVLVGLVVLTIGMAVAGMAPNVYILGAARVFTGVGIGGLLAAATATSSDYCNDKNRSLAVVLVAGGFPLGVYIGATFLAPMLNHHDWRVVFYFGAVLSLAFIPLVYFLVPESISYLARKRPSDALEKIQVAMEKLGHPAPSSLPAQEENITPTIPFKVLFGSNLAFVTTILIFAYFGNIATYYYFVKWLPTVVTDLGYTASAATAVLGVISLGGVVGSISMSIAARYLSIKYLMVVSLIGTAISVWAFPYFTGSLESMKMAGFIAGAFVLAAISGFFGLFASTYPSSLLGSGSGLVLGIGRVGAILGPMIPGFLFAAGLALNNVALIMGSGSLLAGLTVIFLRTQAGARL